MIRRADGMSALFCEDVFGQDLTLLLKCIIIYRIV